MQKANVLSNQLSSLFLSTQYQRVSEKRKGDKTDRHACLLLGHSIAKIYEKQRRLHSINFRAMPIYQKVG